MEMIKLKKKMTARQNTLSLKKKKKRGQREREREGEIRCVEGCEVHLNRSGFFHSPFHHTFGFFMVDSSFVSVFTTICT